MNKDQLNAWRAQGETIDFFDLIKRRREILKENWAQEGYASDPRLGDRALGEIQFINSLLELTAEDFINE